MTTKFHVLPCGKLNLKTGKNLHFNVLQDWTPGDSHLTLYRDEYTGTLKVVAGWGGGIEMPKEVALEHDQTRRPIPDHFTRWTWMGNFSNTTLGLEALQAEVCSNTVAMCVLK